VKDFLRSGPLLRQILSGTDGTGAETMSDRTQSPMSLRPRNSVAFPTPPAGTAVPTEFSACL
jgi:hypothetical protein